MATKRENSRKLEVFNKRCLRSILSISTAEQRTEHISSLQIGQRTGIEVLLEDLGISKETLLVRSFSLYGIRPTPKEITFGWLPQPALRVIE